MEQRRRNHRRLNDRLMAEIQRMARIGVWELDLRKDDLFWTDEIYRIFEIDAERFGASYEAFLDAIHPDDRAAVDRAYRASLEDRRPYEIEHRLLMPDGRTKWVLENGETALAPDGRPLWSLGTVQDVTALHLAELGLRENEERHRLISENSGDVLWVMDCDRMRFTYCSPSVERLLGCTAAEVLEQPVQQALTPGSWVDVTRTMERSLRAIGPGQRTPPVTMLVDQPRKDGTVVSTEVTSTAVVDLQGHTTLYGISRDISERIRTEEELRQYREHLERLVEARTADLEKAMEAAQAADRAKSVFLANMSHEIRTPMNAILGFTQLALADPELSARQREYLRVIARSGDHLLSLINEVLEMSRIEAGQASVRVSAFDLHGLARDLADMFRLRVAEKGLSFRMQLDSSLPRFILADEVKFKEILINLLNNAVKFTRTGGISFLMESTPLEDDGTGPLALLAIEVEDTGIGIGDVEQENLFQPFMQASGGTATHGGTGLGLAISRKHARLMGGDISVMSRIGEGSRFRLELPVGVGSQAPSSGMVSEAVSFVPGGDERTGAPDEPPLEPLGVLSEEDLRRIRTAARSARIDDLLERIASVSGRAPRLAAHLRTLAEEYRYDEILALLKEG